MFGFRWQRTAVLVLLPLITACGSAIKSEPVGAPAAALHASRAAGNSRPQLHPPASPRTDVEDINAVDPVTALIATSDRHFKIGQTELEQGHFEAAKQEFNLAVNVLLESPYGARTEPRVREHFDRLVDRISTYEVRALADGDGFTETKYEPATIDELLALSTTFGTPATTLELKDIVQLDLASTSHDVPIPLNQRVLDYIELFQGRLHDFIEDGLRRGSKYLPMIQNVFRAEGLPLDLAYVPLIESAFKPNALSRVKAKGVWQFMTGTAVENGLRRDWYIDERSDPEKATLAAAKYLRTLSTLFNGDWHLALASYNGGPGRLQRAIKTANLNDFWGLAEKPRALPHETREYVPMILAAIVIARNPAQYGFEFDPEAALAFESVTLPRPVDLRRVAEWTETTIDEIQTLNPELRRWTTPVRDTRYELRVPPGTKDIVLSRLDASPTADLASLKYYTVKHGDTLALVARKLNVSKPDLAEANYLPVSARLTAGDRLIVPHEATVLMAARADRGIPVADARRTVNEAGQLAEATPTNRVRVSYQVKSGDTLASVARLFQTTVVSIKTWNPRLPSDRLTTGQRLTVYRLAD
ncbi:MAG TPA: transglycosylase SLT domain-containing protein [Vicinamibacterales bacterium]|nr:transglycosylase SLT domain-containing protein [Vicinamibacterales bacterium]